MPKLYRYITFVLLLFGILIITLFIQHHVELRESSPRWTETDVYFPPSTENRGRKTNKEEYLKYLINVRLSDNIPINRKIPDSRPVSCRNPGISNLTVSIVVTFYQEWPSILLRTLYSVLLRTDNINEIILVDDGNDETIYIDALQHVHSKFSHIIRLLTLKERLGLIGARLEGVKHVTGDVLIFLDSHMEVNKHWVIPLLKILEDKPKALVMSQLDTINSGTLDYEFSKTYRNRYGFDWRFQFFETEYRKDQLRNGDLLLPGVIAVGSAFAIRTEFFKEIGMYDPHLKIWGGENLELSFKVWLCGGELIHSTCSRIGHITRSQPYLQENRLNIEMYNYKRIADVWLDHYSSYVYDHYPKMKDIPVGDLSKQKRQRTRCKPFSWFLDNVWPELFRYRENTTQFGSLSIRKGSTNYCLDNGEHLFSSSVRLSIKPCSSDYNNQIFGLTRDNRLRTVLQCVYVRKEVFDFIPNIQNCFERPIDQFSYTKAEELIHKATGLCLTFVTSGLVFEKCDDQNNQKWIFK